MKKLSVSARAIALASVLLALAVCNTSCSPSFDVQVPLGDGEFPSFPGLEPGDAIPAVFDALVLPIPDGIPSRDTIEGYITDHGFGFVLALVKLESVELKEMRLTATEGDFDGLTHVAFTWKPAAVNGVTPADVDLSSITSETATMGTELVLTPANPPLDILTLLDNASTHDEGSQPKLSVQVAGTVPDPLTKWTSRMTIGISLKIGLP